MKKLLNVFVLIAIIIFIISKVREYNRYNIGSDYDYQINNEVDVTYHDPIFLQKYYSLCHEIGTFARTIWYNEGIDVKFPDKNNSSSISASKNYYQMITSANYYESILKNSNQIKKQGFSNEEVKFAEQKGLNALGLNCYFFLGNITKINDSNQSIWLVQKLLNKKNFAIKEDGIFNVETQNAVTEFQKKNNLYISKTIDIQTIKKLTE